MFVFGLSVGLYLQFIGVTWRQLPVYKEIDRGFNFNIYPKKGLTHKTDQKIAKHALVRDGPRNVHADIL